MNFDFDKMMVLARENPQEFERQRHDLLEEVIESRADIKWAKAFQSRIDMERRKARTPLGCCIHLYSRMWDSFYNLDEQFQRLLTALDPRNGNKTPQAEETKSLPSAKILMFRKR
ncbi:hypothetical protein SKTS_27020 [Sulfurimicrobium lacus]|uniref:DUF3135 domain-containing protein n=1 Tax=Sulfurimicrobium lacus TaxID=2715678 RepID=A0A6F8VFL3_9PROT|nr:DUF3135 domain-containing protein [Sulfurimicrobium lacus]BCB27816.1 hypothetical protein SKTS_27020 [Sulfurimicrobium lacus]